MKIILLLIVMAVCSFFSAKGKIDLNMTMFFWSSLGTGFAACMLFVEFLKFAFGGCL